MRKRTNRSTGWMDALEGRVLLATDEQLVYGEFDFGLGGYGLFIANFDGSGSFRIPTVAPTPQDPAFTPDRTRVVFESEPENEARDIWIVGEDGSGEARLTNNAAEDTDPEVSPDGQRIVFVSDRDGNDEIYVMDIDGGNVQRLTSSIGSDVTPSFSPDGTKIIFSSNRYSGNYEIVTIDAATGQNLTRLTNNAADDRSPVYSPEGARIAWVSSRGGRSEIWRMGAAGELSGTTRLTEAGQNQSHHSPSFSPDGTQIAYSNSVLGGGEIRIIDAEQGYQYESFGSGYPVGDWGSAARFSGVLGGIGTVFGTASADTITVFVDEVSGELNITRNGVTETWPLEWVTELQIFCGDGKDTLLGDASPVKFYASGDAGDDVMVGGAFNDTLTGGAGRNTLFGGNGNDRLNGSSGRDFLYGDGGDDRLYGNAGNDYILGGGNIDRIWGGAGDDFIAGNGQNDKLFGEDGNDEIYGNDGNDILYGGLNIDILNGGKGSDSADDDDGDTRFAIETVG